MDLYSIAFTLPRSSAPDSAGSVANNAGSNNPALQLAGQQGTAEQAQAQQQQQQQNETQQQQQQQQQEPTRSTTTSPAPVQSFSNLVAQHQRHLASSLGRIGSMRSRFPPSIKGFTSAFSSGGFSSSSKRAATERILEAASKTEAEAEAEAERDREKDRQQMLERQQLQAQQSDSEDQLRSITPGPTSSKKHGFTATFKKASSKAAAAAAAAHSSSSTPSNQALTTAMTTPSLTASTDNDQGAETETEDLQSNAGTTISLASSSKLGSTTTAATSTLSGLFSTSAAHQPYADSVSSAASNAGPTSPGSIAVAAISSAWPHSGIPSSNKQLPLLPPPRSSTDGMSIPMRGAATSPVSNEVVQEAANLEQAIKAAQQQHQQQQQQQQQLLLQASSEGNLISSFGNTHPPPIVATRENATTVHPRARTASMGGTSILSVGGGGGGGGEKGAGGTFGLSVPLSFGRSANSDNRSAGAGGGAQAAAGGAQRENLTQTVARLANEVMTKHGCVVSYTPVYDDNVLGSAPAQNTSVDVTSSGRPGYARQQSAFPASVSQQPYDSPSAAFASPSTHSIPFASNIVNPALTQTSSQQQHPSSQQLHHVNASSTRIPTLDSHHLHLQQQQAHGIAVTTPLPTPGSISSVQTWGGGGGGINSSASSFIERPTQAGTPGLGQGPFHTPGGGGGASNNSAAASAAAAEIYNQLYSSGSASSKNAAAVAAALSAHNLALGMQSTTSLGTVSSLHHYPHSMHEVPYGGGGLGSATTPATPASGLHHGTELHSSTGAGGGNPYFGGGGSGGGGANWNASASALLQPSVLAAASAASSQYSGGGGQHLPKSRGSLPAPAPSTTAFPSSGGSSSILNNNNNNNQQVFPASPMPMPVPTKFNFHISGSFQQVLAARGSLMREQPFKERAVIRVPRVDVLELAPRSGSGAASSQTGSGGSGPASGAASRSGSPPYQLQQSQDGAGHTSGGGAAAGGVSTASPGSVRGLEVLKPFVRQRLEAIASATVTHIWVGKTDSRGIDLGYGLETERVVELVVEGSFESVEQGRVAVLLLLDELSGLHVEAVEIDYKVHNIIGGRKRCTIQSIEQDTATNIYLPTPFAGVLDASSANHSSIKAKQNTIYITGEYHGARRAREILYQSAMAKSTSIISRTTAILPRKVDWMLLERLDELRAVMSDNATFINLPPMGSQTTTLAVYGDNRVNIERTTRSIMTLTAQFYVASVWLTGPSSGPHSGPGFDIYNNGGNGAGTTGGGSGGGHHHHLLHLNNHQGGNSGGGANNGAGAGDGQTLSPEEVNPILTHVSHSSGAEVVFKKNCFELHGLENEVRKAVSQLLDLDLIKSTSFEVRFQIELANEQREFISGKKNGKTNKIMKQCGVRIKFEPFNDYNFFIDLSGTDKISALQGLSLLQEELPAEISFHVPETYHKRIIGVGGKNIQRIMKKYGVYVKFSNAEEFAQLGGYLENEDNVIARTPAKNAINLENLKQSVMELVNEKDREYVMETIVIARRYHRTLLSEKAIFIHDIEQKTGSIIRFPSPERASDSISLFGPESQIHIAAQMLLEHVPFEAEFRTPASMDLVRLLGSQEFAALVERVKRDLSIHIVPFVPPAVGTGAENQLQHQNPADAGPEAVFKLWLNRSNADFLPSAKDLVEDFLISRNMQVFPTPARARSDSFASSLPHFANKLLSPAASMSPSVAGLGVLGPTESNDSLNLELARFNERRALRAAASTPDIKALFGPQHASVVSLGSFGPSLGGGMGGGGSGAGGVYGTSSASASIHASAGLGHSSFFNNGGSSSVHGHPQHGRSHLYGSGGGDAHPSYLHHLGPETSSPLIQSNLYSSPYGHGHAGFNQSDIWGAPRHLPTKSSASLQYPHHISRFSDDTQSIHRIPGEAYYTIGNAPSLPTSSGGNAAGNNVSAASGSAMVEDGSLRGLRKHSSFAHRTQSLDYGGGPNSTGAYTPGGTHAVPRNGSTSSGGMMSRQHGHGSLGPGPGSMPLFHMHTMSGAGSGHGVHGSIANSSDLHFPTTTSSVATHSSSLGPSGLVPDLPSPGARAERLPSTGPPTPGGGHGLGNSVHGSTQSLSRLAQAQAHAHAQAQAHAHAAAQAHAQAQVQAQHAQQAASSTSILGGQGQYVESPSADEVTRLLASIQH